MSQDFGQKFLALQLAMLLLGLLLFFGGLAFKKSRTNDVTAPQIKQEKPLQEQGSKRGP